MSDDLELLRRAFRDVTSCRVGTVRPDGGPHVATRWFVWLEEELWVSTRVGDTTWENASRDPRVSVVIDRGRDWVELAGVRVEGVAESFPAEHPDLRAPMSTWHEKYRRPSWEASRSSGSRRTCPSWDSSVSRPRGSMPGTTAEGSSPGVLRVFRGRA